MKLINKTNWNTLDLKKVLTKVLRQFQKAEGKLYQAKYIVVTVVYRKSIQYKKYILGCICGYKEEIVSEVKHIGWRLEYYNKAHTEDIAWYGANGSKEIREGICPDGEVKILNSEPVFHKYIGGCAWIGGTGITLKLQKDNVDVLELAYTMWHELYHTQGIKSHKRIPSPDFLKDQVRDLVSGMQVNLKP